MIDSVTSEPKRAVSAEEDFTIGELFVDETAEDMMSAFALMELRRVEAISTPAARREEASVGASGTSATIDPPLTG